MKAALYARYSTDRQRDASIEDQLRACERVAQSASLIIIARFEDRGVSGGTAQRAGYQALLAGARAREFEVIVTEDISRLWRNRAEFGPRSAELEDLGVHLVTCVGDDTRRDGGYGLLIGIKQALAEHYRREVSYRTRRGMEGLALAGRSTGGRCYGYALGSVHPAEADTVRRIFERRAAGETTGHIAAALQQAGCPAPRGGAWGRTTVASILANARYRGAVEWGRTEVKRAAVDSSRQQRLMRPEPRVVRSAPELRIVSDDLWARAQLRSDTHSCRVETPVTVGATT